MTRRGLARFFGDERNEAIVAVILADSDEERQAGLRKLRPHELGKSYRPI